MPVFDNIKRKCAEKNISIYSLEKICELSTGSICKWNVSMPKADSLNRVAEHLGCTVSDLLKEDSA